MSAPAADGRAGRRHGRSASRGTRARQGRSSAAGTTRGRGAALAEVLGQRRAGRGGAVLARDRRPSRAGSSRCPCSSTGRMKSSGASTSAPPSARSPREQATSSWTLARAARGAPLQRWPRSRAPPRVVGPAAGARGPAPGSPARRRWLRSARRRRGRRRRRCDGDGAVGDGSRPGRRRSAATGGGAGDVVGGRAAASVPGAARRIVPGAPPRRRPRPGRPADHRRAERAPAARRRGPSGSPARCAPKCGRPASAGPSRFSTRPTGPRPARVQELVERRQVFLARPRLREAARRGAAGDGRRRGSSSSPVARGRRAKRERRGSGVGVTIAAVGGGPAVGHG